MLDPLTKDICFGMIDFGKSFD
jgi:transposase